MYNVENGFNHTDEKFYAPIAGVYAFTASLNLRANIDITATMFLISLSVSTKDHYVMYDPEQYDAVPNWWSINISAQQHLDVGDFAFISFYQTSGTTVTVDGGNGTYFTGCLIG